MAISETVYEKLTNDDARLCDDIPEAACREAPQSFSLMLVSNFLTKLGDAIASPKTTLAWLTTVVGAPAWVLGFLVPIRESGSMVPQLFIGGYIRQLPVRKYVWIAGSIGQFFCIAGIGLTAWYLEGAAAGWSIIALITLFSLARGFSSVASKDVIGKTIPKPKRGQLTGWASSMAGLVSILLGFALMLPLAAGVNTSLIGWLILGAASLWLLAALLFSRIAEYEGATSGGRTAWASLAKLDLLITDKPFRNFVITRALLMCSALSAPYYIALAQGDQSPAWLLGAFIAAAGLASLVSGPAWGRFADRSSKRVMIVAALITSGIGIVTFLADRFAPAVTASAWFLPLAYFVLSVAHSGVRVGRKTYVVNLATGNQRTDYVAISNTVIGLLLLVVGVVGVLTPLIGNAGVIAVLALMGLAGAVLGSTLEDVE